MQEEAITIYYNCAFISFHLVSWHNINEITFMHEESIENSDSIKSWLNCQLCSVNKLNGKGVGVTSQSSSTTSIFFFLMDLLFQSLNYRINASKIVRSI